MPKFTYKGETASGKPVQETVNAPDRFAVYDIARTSGHMVTKVTEAKKISVESLLNMEKINSFLSRVKIDELVVVTRNLASMITAGLPLSRALSVLERQSGNPRLKSTLKAVREGVDKGDPFHEALGKFPKVFSPLYISMVRAGEESGGLSDALHIVSLQLERASNLRKKIKGAMIYPVIVVGVMFIIGILMMIYVIPTLIATFEQFGGDLPVMTKAIIALSKFLTTQGLFALAVAIILVGGLVLFGRTEAGKRTFHYLLVHLPVIGNLAKQTNAARTARTLSSLLSSGVDVVGALTITEGVIQNVYYKDVLKEAAKSVEKGGQLSKVFIEHEKLYPILVGEMIAVGEESGQIAQMLTEMAIFYENEVELKTKDLSTIIEPILMVVIGAGVGFFALAMIAPIYSISESI